MLRILLSGLLALAVVAQSAAQTTPATTTATKKTSARTQTTTRRPAKKARTTTRKTTVNRVGAANTTAQPARPETGGRDDIGPGGNGAVGSTESADGKGQSIHAAPGMPVNVSDPKKVNTYDNKPAGGTNRTTTGTTAPR